MPVVKPQDAAGLLLIRSPLKGAAEVLLGRRHSTARFMPGIYVTPGGRLEPSDRRPSGFPEAVRQTEGAIDLATRRGLLALSRCALRETAEETGLLVGRRGSSDCVPTAAWSSFAEAGLTPAFEDLRLIARAITPAHSPIRFHTRFFMADGALALGALRGDGELEDLRWVPTSALTELPMAEVTRLVIQEAVRPHNGRAAVRSFTWRGKTRLSR